MPEMLFESIGSRMMPVLPGKDRVADRVRFFSLADAADRLRCSKEELSNEWLCYFSPNSPEPDSDVIESITPVVLAATDAVSSAINASRLRALHTVRFPHLSTEHWQYVVSDCDRRKLDPSLVWVKLERNDEGLFVPVIITTIAAFRLIAERSGLRNGETSPQWCGRDGVWKDVWPDPDHPPYAARVAVLKKGVDQPYEGIAYWKTHAQYRVGPDGLPVLERMWEIGGPHMLAKCASAIAHREGWPDETGGLYTNDEIRAPQDRQLVARALEFNAVDCESESVRTMAVPPRAPVMAFPDDPGFAWKLVDETTPESVTRLELELMEAGITPRSQAVAVVGRFKQALPRLFGGHLRAFCAAVLKCVRENPSAYDLPVL